MTKLTKSEILVAAEDYYTVVDRYGKEVDVENMLDDGEVCECDVIPTTGVDLSIYCNETLQLTDFDIDELFDDPKLWY